MWENLVITHIQWIVVHSKHLFFIFSFKATCHLRKLEKDDFKISKTPFCSHLFHQKCIIEWIKAKIKTIKSNNVVFAIHLQRRGWRIIELQWYSLFCLQLPVLLTFNIASLSNLQGYIFYIPRKWKGKTKNCLWFTPIWFNLYIISRNFDQIILLNCLRN